MRVVEADEIGAGPGGIRFRLAIVVWTDAETAAPAFLGDVGQRQCVANLERHVVARGTDEGAAAFIGVGVNRVAADRGGGGAVQPDGAHARSSQNRSERYREPPSGKIVTTVPPGADAATRAAATAAAPLETPAKMPYFAARCLAISCASSVETRMSSSA